MSKFVQFFATERGRKTSGALAMAAVASGVLAKYLPHSRILSCTAPTLTQDGVLEFLKLVKGVSGSKGPLIKSCSRIGWRHSRG